MTARDFVARVTKSTAPTRERRAAEYAEMASIYAREASRGARKRFAAKKARAYEAARDRELGLRRLRISKSQARLLGEILEEDFRHDDDPVLFALCDKLLAHEGTSLAVTCEEVAIVWDEAYRYASELGDALWTVVASAGRLRQSRWYREGRLANRKE